MCQIQNNLKKDLKKFGLNPEEWTVRKLKEKTYKVMHIKDHQFYFHGQTKQVGVLPEWSQLRLFSL
ncbi:hypothetical protein [Bdellovibrio sp. HCB337]|uniref:hypothetical protein n=1 Tax=Bdellovibrio sp. HCB337 TaxID=3394358 RepID=UPI0039A4CDD4